MSGENPTSASHKVCCVLRSPHLEGGTLSQNVSTERDFLPIVIPGIYLA